MAETRAPAKRATENAASARGFTPARIAGVIRFNARLTPPSDESWSEWPVLALASGRCASRLTASGEAAALAIGERVMACREAPRRDG
jgi:hypothetical protein